MVPCSFMHPFLYINNLSFTKRDRNGLQSVSTETADFLCSCFSMTGFEFFSENVGQAGIYPADPTSAVGIVRLTKKKRSSGEAFRVALANKPAETAHKQRGHAEWTGSVFRQTEKSSKMF